MRWFRSAWRHALVLILVASANLGADEARDQADFKVLLARAEAGDLDEQYKVAYYYWNGWGVPKSPGRFAHWLRSAAVAGHARAQWDLATNLRLGSDGAFEVNANEAMAWLRKAAVAGFAPAQAELAQNLWNGRLLDKNRAEAMVWMRRAALGGDEQAATWMGLRHEQGDEVTTDSVEALGWYIFAGRCLRERRLRDPNGGYGSEGEPLVAEQRLRPALSLAEQSKAQFRFEALWAEHLAARK